MCSHPPATADALASALLASSPDCVKLLDLSGRLEYMNGPGLCLMEVDDFGAIRGADWPSVWPGDGARQARDAVAAARAGATARFQAPCPTLKGTPKWWDVTVAPVADAGGTVVRLLSASRDITAMKSAEARARAREAYFRALVEEAADAVFVLDLDFVVRYASPSVARLLGHARDDYVARDAEDGPAAPHTFDFVHLADLPALAQALGRAAREPGLGVSATVRVRHRDGTWRSMEGVARLHRPSHPSPLGPSHAAAEGEPLLVLNVRDVTERLRTEEALRLVRRQQAALLDNIPDLAWLRDAEGRYVAANEPLARSMGLEPAAMIGRTNAELLPPETASLAAAFDEEDRAVIARGERVTVETAYVQDDGSTRYLETVKTPYRDDAGAVVGTVGIARDVSAHKQLEGALRRLALQDELTGLLNRRGFLERADQEWRRAGREGWPMLLVYLDLDGFKAVNDAHGHAEGDRALRVVASILRATFREADVIARLGGDEFAVLAPNADPACESAILDRLAGRVAEFNARAQAPFRLALTAGTARADGPHAATLEEMLARADAALYAGKRARRIASAPDR